MPLFRFAHGDVGGQQLQHGLGSDGVVCVMHAEGKPFKPVRAGICFPSKAGYRRGFFCIAGHKLTRQRRVRIGAHSGSDENRIQNFFHSVHAARTVRVNNLLERFAAKLCGGSGPLQGLPHLAQSARQGKKGPGGTHPFDEHIAKTAWQAVLRFHPQGKRLLRDQGAQFLVLCQRFGQPRVKRG